MKVTLKDGRCIVEREPGDPKFHGVTNAAGESRLLHHVKRELNKQGFDFVKKRMWKDGHLVDNLQQYLRERRPVDGRVLAIYNDAWAIRGAEVDFNAGRASLAATDIGPGAGE